MGENACMNCQYKYLDAPCRDCMSHDSLAAEVERLKQENEKLTKLRAEVCLKLCCKEIERVDLQKENEKLKEILRGFDPIIDNDDTDFAYCKFCRNRESKGHRDDCEYVRLTD